MLAPEHLPEVNLSENTADISAQESHTKDPELPKSEDPAASKPEDLKTDLFETGQMIAKIANKASNFNTETRSYKYGIIIVACGGLVLLLSLFYLPFALFSPRSFCQMFSFGSILCFVGMTTMFGIQKMKETLFSKPVLPYTGLFLVGMVAGYWFSSSSPYLSLLSLVVEVSSKIWLNLIKTWVALLDDDLLAIFWPLG